MKVDCTRRTEQVESELAATRQRLKAKEAELNGAQQQLTQLTAELKELTVSSTCKVLAVLALNVSYDFHAPLAYNVLLCKACFPEFLLNPR